MSLRSHFLRVDPTRAILEALILGILLCLTLFSLRSLFAFIWQIGLSLCIGLGCGVWCALRLKLPDGQRRQQVFFETTSGVMLCLLLGILELLIILILRGGTVSYVLWQGPIRPALLAIIAFILNYVIFLLLRLGVRLWLFWNYLRHTQLVWGLTYAHVLVLFTLAGSALVLLEIIIITHLSDVFLVVSTTIGLLILGMIILVVIIPPSILFSYLVMRRTTQRIKALAAATSSLREGNYGIRIQVAGEDEVAQLQTDFNSMASSLELSMRELQEERDRVAILLKERRELIANVSHELRTPVATLRSYLETTLMHWDERSTPIKQHEVQVMEEEVINLQLLVNDLFTLARTDVGKLELHFEPTDVSQLIRRVVEKVAPFAWQSSRIEIVAEAPSEAINLLVDPKRLEQVLQNLLHNAIRHTTPGGIVVIEVKAKAEVVLILVKDTGDGISSKDLPYIWERYYQTERSQMSSNDGAGLGLAIVKEWIEEMGGTVTVESMVGEGSRFTLHLPYSIESSPRPILKGEMPDHLKAEHDLDDCN